SIGQGSQLGRKVVQIGGVSNAIAAAVARAPAIPRCRDLATWLAGLARFPFAGSFSATVALFDCACGKEAVSQHRAPINIIDRPRMLRTSTRSKSVHGDHGYPRANSWTRNSSPSP